MVNKTEQDKRFARAAARAARRALSTEAHRDASARIQERVAALPQYRNATALLGYAAVGDEVDTWPLLRAAWAEGRDLYLPYLTDTGMAWAGVTEESALLPGRHGIREPAADRRTEATIPAGAVVLTPCLLFNIRGYRLGYGGGYFDRFLAGFKGLSIALAFDLQEHAALPVEPHDQRVHLVVTESRTISCRPRPE